MSVQEQRDQAYARIEAYRQANPGSLESHGRDVARQNFINAQSPEWRHLGPRYNPELEQRQALGRQRAKAHGELAAVGRQQQALKGQIEAAGGYFNFQYEDPRRFPHLSGLSKTQALLAQDRDRLRRARNVVGTQQTVLAEAQASRYRPSGTQAVGIPLTTSFSSTPLGQLVSFTQGLFGFFTGRR